MHPDSNMSLARFLFLVYRLTNSPMVLHRNLKFIPNKAIGIPNKKVSAITAETSESIGLLTLSTLALMHMHCGRPERGTAPAIEH